MSDVARTDLAPTGTLRVGINFGNPLLARRAERSREAGGIAVDLARELGRRLSVPIELIPYEAAGKMAEGASQGAWDVAFLAVDPARAAEILFTAPYLEIDTTYLLPAGSPLASLAAIDRPGVRIAVSNKSAYDLFLSRSLQHATLVRAPSVEASLTMFIEDQLDALSGLKPWLLTTAKTLPGSRVLDDRFTVVGQAVGTPKGRDAGSRYLSEFVEAIKSSGQVAHAIAHNGVQGVTVAPAASREQSR
jgi:polar amino acid transport system substrate-binding protein